MFMIIVSLPFLVHMFFDGKVTLIYVSYIWLFLFNGSHVINYIYIHFVNESVMILIVG